MTLHARRYLIIGSILLIFAGMVYGATRKPRMAIPAITEVKSAQVILNVPQPNPNPIMNTPKNKPKIAELLGWLSSARPIKYVQPAGIIMTFGPTILEFRMKNHTWIDIAFGSKQTVYITASDTNAKVQYYSPAIAGWLEAQQKNAFK